MVNTVVPLMIIMKCNRKSLKTLQYYTAVKFYHTITLFHFQFCGLCYGPDISWKNVPWLFKIFIIYIDIKYYCNQILTAENFGGWITQLYCMFALNDLVIIFLFIIRKIIEWMLFFNNCVNHKNVKVERFSIKDWGVKRSWLISFEQHHITVTSK